MSKRMMQLLALGLSAMLVFSLAACGGEETPDTSSGSESVSDTVAASESAAPAAESETAEPTSGEVEYGNSTQTPVAPQSKEELIAAFNNAGGSRLSCTSSSQKITSGKLWMGDNSDEYIDLLAPDQTTLLAKFEKTASSGVQLPALSAGNVASASVSGTTVTFTFNSTTADHDSVAQGMAGYVNIIDQSRTEELVAGVKEYAGVPGSVKISSVSHSLYDGKLTVEFNSDFTQVTSVKFTARQHVQAQMRYLIMTINADLNYDLTSEYK